jgi:hypothetical protein
MHSVSRTQNFCKAHLVYAAINRPKINEIYGKKIQSRNKLINIAKHLGLALASSSKLCDDHVSGGTVGKIKREMNTTLNQCQVLPKCMLLTTILFAM